MSIYFSAGIVLHINIEQKQDKINTSIFMDCILESNKDFFTFPLLNKQMQVTQENKYVFKK